MPNVYQPGLIQLRPQYTTGAADELDTPENVLWYTGGNLSAFPLTSIQLAVIGNAFDVAWGNLWKPMGSATYAYTGSVITDWSISTGQEETSVGTFAPVAGTTSGALPSNVSVLTSHAANGMPKYRGGHPRTYLPFMGDGHMVDAFKWDPSEIATVHARWVDLDTAMASVGSGNGGPYNQSVYRFRNDIAKAHIYPVTGHLVQTRPATQRRRLRKAPHH